MKKAPKEGKTMAAKKAEYAVELQVGGQWWTPIRIFATNGEAAMQKAVRLIKKHGADKTRLWGTIGNAWMPIARYIGTSRTLYRF